MWRPGTPENKSMCLFEIVIILLNLKLYSTLRFVTISLLTKQHCLHNVIVFITSATLLHTLV